jgi:release factor glutamine methyltransferase
MNARKVFRMLLNIPYRRYVLRRIATESEVRLFGMRLKTHPEVFNPLYFHSTEILINKASELPLVGKRILDVGTGSGAVGIYASLAGGHVTACDINPAAIALAQENAALNRAKMTILYSNLFESLEGQLFDYILFNVPFYPKVPLNSFEAAFNAGENYETIRRFATQLPMHLSDDGQAIVIFSEDCGYQNIVAFFSNAGLTVRERCNATTYAERFHIITIAKSST